MGKTGAASASAAGFHGIKFFKKSSCVGGAAHWALLPYRNGLLVVAHGVPRLFKVIGCARIFGQWPKQNVSGAVCAARVMVASRKLEELFFVETDWTAAGICFFDFFAC